MDRLKPSSRHSASSPDASRRLKKAAVFSSPTKARTDSTSLPLKCHVSTFGYHPDADYQVVVDREVPRVGILRDGMWLVQWTNQMVVDTMP